MTINEHYLLDNYGFCKLEAACTCLRNTWMGRVCLNWQPSGFLTLEDLKDNAEKILEGKKCESPNQ